MKQHIALSEQPLQVGDGERWLLDQGLSGALVNFSGWVRGDLDCQGQRVDALFLEHYPGMTERAMCAIVEQARLKWPLNGAWIVHRVGTVALGEEIVQVAVSASHRSDAFAACAFIMDMLKTRVPLWKKAFSGGVWHWVEARQSDAEAASAWLQQL